jgi:carbamoyltransferase
MLIVGFNGGVKSQEHDDPMLGQHDAAAVLVHDGRVIAAIEEERLDRLKHSNCFPSNAIRFCLDAAGAALTDVDVFATNDTRSTIDWRVKQEYLWNPLVAEPLQDAAAYLNSRFQLHFQIDVLQRLQFCHHHLAHAASAFFPSGFDEALIFTIDGSGDGLSGMVLNADSSGMTTLREFPMRNSLGHLYLSLIGMLGYRVFDEYKVMGLAPYGDPTRLASLFERHYSLDENGSYSLAPIRDWFKDFDSLGLLGRARRKNYPFTQWHKDWAAALQATLERIILHVLTYFRRETGLKNLCLAGGVAHNCTANGKILYSGLFDRVFVQPAAHDAGGALGAALYVWSMADRNSLRNRQSSQVYWGTPTNQDDAQAALARWSQLLDFRVVDDVAASTADLLADGNVIGWVQGRSEFGPRALGNRSILADPRPASNRDRVNWMIKKREGYRPFAPSVTEEDAERYFDLPPRQKSFPFMIFVLRVKPEARQLLGAVTHVDGSARVHTVSPTANPLYWKLIREFGIRTGVPVLLNTSFNNAWEPIVDSVEDAIHCFLTTGLDYLVIGNCIARKRFESIPCHVAIQLSPFVARHYQITRRAPDLYELVGLKHQAFCSPRTAISRTTALLLADADGCSDLSTLALNAGISGPDLEESLPEIIRLWEERLIRMRPALNRDLLFALTSRLATSQGIPTSLAASIPPAGS